MNEKFDKLLILDLDETLIHATEKEIAFREDFRFNEYRVQVIKLVLLSQFCSFFSKFDE